MSDKQKFPLSVAEALAKKIVTILAPACERIIVAGSVRRRKPMVGDIEILYIPKFAEAPDPQDLFGKTIKTNAMDACLEELIRAGHLEKRPVGARLSEPQNPGHSSWGEHNKLARAVKTGINVDFFATNADAWFNYLVCRTGSAETNIKIAAAAKNRYCQWCPYSGGFLQQYASGERRLWIMRSEQDVFKFAGLPYLEPHER